MSLSESEVAVLLKKVTDIAINKTALIDLDLDTILQLLYIGNETKDKWLPGINLYNLLLTVAQYGKVGDPLPYSLRMTGLSSLASACKIPKEKWVPQLVNIARTIVEKRNAFVYCDPLTLDIRTIQRMLVWDNVGKDTWLPGVHLYLSLIYASCTRIEVAKMSSSDSKFEAMSALAVLVGMPDDEWMPGIKRVVPEETVKGSRTK